MRTSLFAFGACALAACSTAPAPRHATDVSLQDLPVRICNAEAASRVVGRMADEQTLGEAKRLAGALTVRTLRPGMPEAMNFNSGRLNLQLDSSGRIVALSCG